jgi:hypothetical protein
MPVDQKDAITRIAHFLADELGGTVFDIVAPATLEASVSLLASMSPETKKAIGYVIVNRILGVFMAQGPAGMLGPLEKWLESEGLSPAQATGMVSKALICLDDAIGKRRPN